MIEKLIIKAGGNKFFALFSGLIFIPTAASIMEYMGRSQAVIETSLYVMSGLVISFMGTQAYSDAKTNGLTSRSAKQSFLQTLQGAKDASSQS